MKNIKLVSVATLVGLSILSSTSVFAADETGLKSNAESKNNISFIANDEPTGPVNPIDPEEPVDPEKPIDPEDPENNGTGNPGPLSIDYVSNVKFGEQKISSKVVVYNALNEAPFVQVTDNRGTGEGWDLSAKISEFKSENDKVLKGALLSFKDGEVKTTPNNVSGLAVGQDVSFDNTDSKTMMSAGKDAGRGVWLDVFQGEHKNNSKVQLEVIGGSAEAVAYTATINWELSDAPKA